MPDPGRMPRKITQDSSTFLTVKNTGISLKRTQGRNLRAQGMQKTTSSVMIQNNCGFDAFIGIVYSTLNAANNFYRWPLLQNGTSLTLAGVSDSVLFIYGIRTNDLSPVWTSQTSARCFSGGQGCFSQRNVGSLQSGVVTYNICRPPDIGTVAQSGSENLDQTASEWLKEHNDRRKVFYSRYGKDPLDLKWSESLRASALNYANQLITIGGGDDCFIEHGYNGDSYGGENLAAFWGFGSSLPSYNPADVLRDWFDNQINLPFGKNMHATQVVFRSSHYVGCGEAEKDLNSGGKCYIKVCRYLSPGNCNITPENWLERTLDDTVICGPPCPSEGCF
jgi:hypothetical protein